MKKIILFMAIFLIGISVHTKAAFDFSNTFITSADGLSHNSISSLYQDKKGFVWCCTSNGLNRYDGYSFISFFPNKAEDVSLIDNRVRNVREDKNGFLWVYLDSQSFSCFDMKKGKFVDYTGCGAYQRHYQKIMIASNGDVWLWHKDKGCCRVSFKNGKFTSVFYNIKKGNIASDIINFVAEGSGSSVWVGTGKGLLKVDPSKTVLINKEQSFVSVVKFQGNSFFLTDRGAVYVYDSNGMHRVGFLDRNVNDFEYQADYEISGNWTIASRGKTYVFNLSSRKLLFEEKQENEIKLHSDECGDIWISNGTGCVEYIQKDTGIKRKFQLIPSTLIQSIGKEQYHIVRDHIGRIWISTYGNGLFVYNPMADKMTHYLYSSKWQTQIPSNFLTYLMKDRNGNIWVASELSGISIISVINEGSCRIFPESEESNDRSNEIQKIELMRDGNYWVSNRKGNLYVYDAHFGKKLQKENYPYGIFSIIYDKQGNLWKGSMGNGIYVNETNYKNNPFDSKSLSDNHIYCISSDSKGRIWICTFGGGVNLAVNKRNKLEFSHFFTGKNGLSGNFREIKMDKKGWMWAIGNDGLFVFHPDSLIANPSKFYLYNYAKGNLMGSELHSLTIDKEGRVWIGTLGAGLSVCKPNGDYGHLKFQTFNVKDGLVYNVVQSIIEDRQGKIWIGTEYGMSCFDCKKKVFENYYFSATMPGNFYTVNSARMDQEGKLLFGTNEGLVIIDPLKVKSLHNEQNVVLTDLKIDGLSVNVADEDSPMDQTISFSKKINLKYNQNSFSIEFSVFDYNIPRGTKYTYWLENYDNNWSVPSRINVATYKNLSPGNYRLHVKASNTAGVWTTKETVLDIRITPPFWETIWAYLFYIAFFAFVVWLAYRMLSKINSLHNRIQVEKQLTEYKLKFFTNIAHEFRSPLTLIEGGLEKLFQLKTLPSEAKQPLSGIYTSSKRLMRLIDQLLTFRKIQSGKLSLHIQKLEIIEPIRDIFESFRSSTYSKNITYRFIPFAQQFEMYADYDFLDKILYNLLSNALKYTMENGFITLFVQKDENELIIKVEDTGIGIPKDKQEKLFNRFAQFTTSTDSFGIGLNVAKDLCEAHHGHIRYKENPKGGSVFIVSLPLSLTCYKDTDMTDANVQSHKNNKTEHDFEMQKDISILGHPINSNVKMLIIEDDSDIRSYIQNIMKNYFLISSAADGKTGLDLSKSFQPDIVLCDALMPVMNGFDVIKQLKKNKETADIPIILLTSLSEDEDRIHAYECGADDFITKPFSVRLLLVRVFNIIRQRKKLKQKFGEEKVQLIGESLVTNNEDKRFIEKLDYILEQNISDSSFSVDLFAEAMGYGRTSFFQKVGEVTGLTPNEYLRNARLKKAIELMKNNDRITVSEIAYQTGFSDPAYFSRCFKNIYGMTPSQYKDTKLNRF